MNSPSRNPGSHFCSHRSIGLVFALSIAVWYGWAAEVAAQGVVLFSTRVFNQVVAPVYGPEAGDPTLPKTGNTAGGFPIGSQTYSGALVDGAGYTAELWAGPTNAAECELVALARTTFRTGVDAGFVQTPPSLVTVPFAAPGGRVMFQLRAWDNQGGTVASWSQAQCGQAPRGASSPFLSEPLGTSGGPSYLRGLQSFNLFTSANASYEIHVSLGGCESRPNFPVNVFQGENVTLTLRCPQPGAFVHWARSGFDIPGANSATLLLPNIQFNQAGDYTLTDTLPPPGAVPPVLTLRVVPRPRLSAPQVTSFGHFAFTISGVTNRYVAFEVSSNLTAWSTWTNHHVFNGSGLIQFRGPLPSGARFFRARPIAGFL